MNKRLLLLFFGGAFLTLSACTSEYEERLLKARKIKAEINRIEQQSERLGNVFAQEIEELNSEIHFHARVSGNEDLFFKELMDR